MKKKLIAIIIIALIIIGIIILKNVQSESSINYEIAKIETYKYVKYRKNDKFGVMDRDGNIILEARYFNIQIPNPEKDLFICYEEENSGSIALNKDKTVLFGKYNNIEPIKIKNMATTLCYEKNALKYQKDGLYGLIDFNGKQLTKNIYSAIENLEGTEGKFQVCKDGKYGVINQKGTLIVDTKFDKITTDGYYNEEKKYVEAGYIVSNTMDDGYRYGYIDYRGKQLLKVEYNDIVRILSQKEVYLIVSKSGQYGLYRGKKQLIKTEYQNIYYTDNGAIVITKNGQFGIANLRGDIKVQPKYASIDENGIYLYAQNSTDNSVYDIEGNKIDINFNKCIYETTNENYKITTILNNDIIYYGIENKDGTTLVENTYSYIEYICSDFFIAENKEEKYGVINANGAIKLNFDYDLIQKIKNKNILQAQKTKSNKIDLYSSKIESIISMKSAKIQNQKNYLKVYNDKKEVFLDAEGNEIKENDDIVQKEIKSELPEKIQGYNKVQYSLEDAYYE